MERDFEHQKAAQKLYQFLQLQRIPSALAASCLALEKYFACFSESIHSVQCLVWDQPQQSYLIATEQGFVRQKGRSKFIAEHPITDSAVQIVSDQQCMQAIQLVPDAQGLIILNVHQASQLDWALGLLQGFVSAQQAAKYLVSLQTALTQDPQPSLRVLDCGKVAESNQAVQQLQQLSGGELEQLLPSNHQALIRACLQQARAIEGVETSFKKLIMHWSYIPMLAQQQVLVRGKDVSEQVKQARQAAQAWRLYRLITENSMDLISRHAPDGRFIDASPASWSLLGYWPEEMRGLHSMALFHPEDARRQMHNAYNALRDLGYYTMTWRALHRKGHYVWFETASRAIRETYTGAVVEIVSISRDITQRVLVEEHRQRLAEVVQANTDLVLFLLPSGQVTGANPSAQSALQVQAEQKFSIEQVISPDDYSRLKNIGWQQAKQLGVWSSEMRLQPLAGKTSFPVSLVLLAHRGQTGEPYYSLVARDMTERERHEIQQRRHQDELAHSARLVTLGELTSGIAHEMNQPLAAIMNYSNASLRYLQQGQSGAQLDKVEQGLQRVNEHAKHAAEVIKQLRALLRKEPRRLQALLINQVIDEAVRLCQWQASSWQIKIVTQLTADLPEIYADRVLLEQVLLNLLRNAMEANHQATPEQASEIQLAATLTEQQRILIEVKDQGYGVKQENLEQLFTPFYTEKKDGLGLGLSMSRSIIEGFGGELTARRLEQGGLALQCYLPLREVKNLVSHKLEV